MKILIVHEVNYLKKIIYEFQILPEILSMLGNEVTIIDYDDTWKTSSNGEASGLRTRGSPGVRRRIGNRFAARHDSLSCNIAYFSSGYIRDRSLSLPA